MECKRCGTCCRKGGPALHKQDLAILQQGAILPHQLVTFRKGEPAFDPGRSELISLPSDLIKIRGAGGIGCCIFFLPQENACSIYQDRPLECRMLKCWDTADIEALFLKDLLSRKDLFGGSDTIMELIAAHESAFPVDALLGLEKEALETAVREELRFRQKVMEGYGIQAETLDLILGRSIKSILEAAPGTP